jgi:tRNA pseudouridine38-40 synthase
MINYKVTLEYDGTNYEGVQSQKETNNTIYSKLENSLQKLLAGGPSGLIELNFCGRTDAGVHAFGQVINVKTTKEFQDGKLALGINYYLRGEKIAAVASHVVPNDFHARYSCKERFYTYKILNRSFKSPIYENRAWLIPYHLNIDAMQEACKLLVGTHDFSYFRNADCYSNTPIKTINQLHIKQTREFLKVEISAESFLYRMVRRIVGVLVEVGRGEVLPEEIKLMLSGKYNQNIQTAPSHGLYFMKAIY